MRLKFASMSSKQYFNTTVPDSLSMALEKRKSKESLRKLVDLHQLIDFSSNDYLGLSRNKDLIKRIEHRMEMEGHLPLGATGSRLISGNNKYFEQLEERLAGIFKSEASILYNSGYAANQGVLSAVAQKGDTILYDALAHVCIKEGAWLSKAQSYSFRHNDLEDLREKLNRAEGTIYVATETIFSMDGDIAPLEELISLCEEFGAYLIVDEAHSTGSYGPEGAGILVDRGLEQRVFARVYTFGKAMGLHGAVVAGARMLKDYLVNFSRSFIYTTSLPPYSLISIDEAFHFLTDHIELQKDLQDRIKLFTSSLSESAWLQDQTAIQPVMVPGNQKCRNLAGHLQKEGFDVRPILAPTVREGTERLRVSLHVHNSNDQIERLARLLNQLI